jgi:hypothetical protein
MGILLILSEVNQALPMVNNEQDYPGNEVIDHDLMAEESFHYLKNILAATYDLLSNKAAFFRANTAVIIPAAAIIRSIAPSASDSFQHAGLPPHGALSLPFFTPQPQKVPAGRPHRVPSFKKTFPEAPSPKALFKEHIYPLTIHN